MKPTEIDRLVDSLARPIYILRMARPLELSCNEPMQKSARTRAMRARQEIHDIISQYETNRDR